MSTSRSLVSIVIPAYNAADFIGNALDAALGQTYDAIEIITIDDGCTDNTAQIIQSYDDNRIRYIRQENQGQSAAINRGVQESSGDLIKLFDADDWINREHIETQVASIGERNDVVSSCRWGYFVEDFTKPVVFDEYTNRDYDDPLEWLIDSLQKDEGMMGGWKWLIPRSVWDKAGGYDPRLGLNNDFHFSIQLLLSSGGVRFANDAVYSYRKGVSGAVSGSGDRKAMESALLTTQLGSQLLLDREDSTRIRSICADRYQQWLFCFYPEFPDLARRAEAKIQELGGSSLKLPGGRLLQLLRPIIGWKGVRRLQSLVRRCGWRKVLAHKSRRRLSEFQ